MCHVHRIVIFAILLAACGVTEAPRGQAVPTPTAPAPFDLQVTWIGADRIAVSWQQHAEGDLCLSKLHNPMYGYVFYGCHWYQPGAHRIEIGGPDIVPEEQPVAGELYILHQGGAFLAQTELSMQHWLYLPLIRA